MEITAVFTLIGIAIAAVAAVVALIGLFWKIPQEIGKSEQRLNDKIGGVERHLGDKFDEINRSVGRIEGRLEGRPMAAQTSPQE